jgi:UDP:flavonoid glycosyltransferase YjiC (YdhE family)
VFAASPNHRAWIESQGQRFHSAGFDLEAPSEATDQSMANPLRAAINGIKLVMNLVPEQFRALTELIDDADLVIGSGLEFAGRSLAELKGIPYRFVCHVPTALRSQYHPPVAIPYRAFPRWVNRCLWWTNAMGTKLTFGRAIQRERARRKMSPVRDFGGFFSRDIVIAADSRLAPLPPDCVSQFRTGYFALPDDTELPSDLAEFLASGEPPVYWGFGSMLDPTPVKSLRMLEELSRTRRFVVLNRRAHSACTRHLPNVFWVESVSHQALFPRVAAVVHHGGAGTTHTAARAGVPQIIVPHLLDQYYWAYSVQRLGIGPPALGLRRLSAAALSTSLDQVAPGSTMQRAAAALAEELRIASANSLQAAVQYLETLGVH